MIPRICRASLARPALPLSFSVKGSRISQRCLSRSVPNANAEAHSDNRLRFPGALQAKFTTDLSFENPKEKEAIPCYRVVDSEGVVVDKSYKRDISDEEAIKLYENMLGISIMDQVCMQAQRQGISNKQFTGIQRD
jgi:hypothetical protein